jgi:hypothetical protein
LQILDETSAATDDDDDDATAAESLPEGDGRRAENFTSDSAEKSGDMPDRGTTLVPFRVTPGEGHPPPTAKTNEYFHETNKLQCGGRFLFLFIYFFFTNDIT